MKSHRQRIDDLHLADASSKFPGPSALITLETEFHVLGGDGVAVVELEAAAQLELVHEPVRALRPRLRQAVAHLLPRHRADQRIVERIQHTEGCDLWRGGWWGEPGRGGGNGAGPHCLSPGGVLAIYPPGSSPRLRGGPAQPGGTEMCWRKPRFP